LERALAEKTAECEKVSELSTKKHEIGLRWQKAATENRTTLEARTKEVESKTAEVAALSAEVERLTREATEGVAAKDAELEQLKKELESLKAQVAQGASSDSPAMVSTLEVRNEMLTETVGATARSRSASGPARCSTSSLGRGEYQGRGSGRGAEEVGRREGRLGISAFPLSARDVMLTCQQTHEEKVMKVNRTNQVLHRKLEELKGQVKTLQEAAAAAPAPAPATDAEAAAPAPASDEAIAQAVKDAVAAREAELAEAHAKALAAAQAAASVPGADAAATEEAIKAAVAAREAELEAAHKAALEAMPKPETTDDAQEEIKRIKEQLAQVEKAKASAMALQRTRLDKLTAENKKLKEAAAAAGVSTAPAAASKPAAPAPVPVATPATTATPAAATAPTAVSARGGAVARGTIRGRGASVRGAARGGRGGAANPGSAVLNGT
jgi:nucleoprotein TPR